MRGCFSCPVLVAAALRIFVAVQMVFRPDGSDSPVLFQEGVIGLALLFGLATMAPSGSIRTGTDRTYVQRYRRPGVRRGERVHAVWRFVLGSYTLIKSGRDSLVLSADNGYLGGTKLGAGTHDLMVLSAARTGATTFTGKAMLEIANAAALSS